jgi:hypothetical protein
MDAGAAWDEEAGTRLISVEAGEPKEPGPETGGGGNRVAEDRGDRQTAQARGERALRHI